MAKKVTVQVPLWRIKMLFYMRLVFLIICIGIAAYMALNLPLEDVAMNFGFLVVLAVILLASVIVHVKRFGWK